MKIIDIITADALNNHPGTSADSSHKKVLLYLQSGYTLYKAGDTVVMYKAFGDTVKYHSINAAPVRDFVNSGHRFFNEISEYAAAYTTIMTRPQLEVVVRRYFKKSTVIRRGKAITNLRKL